MLKKISLKKKLIIACVIPLSGIMILAISGNMAMEKTRTISTIVKEKKINAALIMEKIVFLGHDIITAIEGSANAAIEDGLIAAEKKKQELTAYQKQIMDLIDERKLQACLKNHQ